MKQIFFYCMFICSAFLYAQESLEKILKDNIVMPIEYCRVLKAGNRDEILKINPKISEYTPYAHEYDRYSYWYEIGTYSLMELTISKSNAQQRTELRFGQTMVLEVIQMKDSNNFLVKQTDYSKRVFEKSIPRIIDLAKLASEEPFFITFQRDGDYLRISSKQKDYYQEYFFATEYTYDQICSLIFYDIVDPSLVTWPRHADGSCDYETVVRLQSGKGYRASDNLRLRSSGSKAGKHVVTIGKGTQVKVLSIGAEQTLDGIISNWVQVEVQAGAKDRDGKAIAAGTTGWLFGGYLTE